MGGPLGPNQIRIRPRCADMATTVELYATRKWADGFSFSATATGSENSRTLSISPRPGITNRHSRHQARYGRPHPMDRLLCGDVGYQDRGVMRPPSKASAMGGRLPCWLLLQFSISASRNLQRRFQPFPVRVENVQSLPLTKELKAGLAIWPKAKWTLHRDHRLLSQDVRVSDLVWSSWMKSNVLASSTKNAQAIEKAGGCYRHERYSHPQNTTYSY